MVNSLNVTTVVGHIVCKFSDCVVRQSYSGSITKIRTHVHRQSKTEDHTDTSL